MDEELKPLKKQTHGTVACYLHTHCSCEKCRKAWSEYNKDKFKEARERVKAGYQFKHGSVYSYTIYGCRCEPCRAAKKIAINKYSGQEPKVHGTFRSYRVLRCRCDICREFNTRYMRQYREAKRARILAKAFPMSNV